MDLKNLQLSTVYNNCIPSVCYFLTYWINISIFKNKIVNFSTIVFGIESWQVNILRSHRVSTTQPKLDPARTPSWRSRRTVALSKQQLIYNLCNLACLCETSNNSREVSGKCLSLSFSNSIKLELHTHSINRHSFINILAYTYTIHRPCTIIKYHADFYMRNKTYIFYTNVKSNEEHATVKWY